jgi:hypothetical protein
MPSPHLGMSRSWAWPVAGCAMLLVGCNRAQTPEARLVQRSEQAVAELERLGPRLAKAGTPEAEALADNLASVRESLAALPVAVASDQQPAASDQQPAASDQQPADDPPITAQVRCPDDGCWRLGLQVEAGIWRLNLDGGGGELDDTGPLAVGLALGLERSYPLDHRLEWSWGAELVANLQDRTGGQRIALVGVRPFVRGALAVSDTVALTLRPLIEVGQPSVQLGDAPGGVLDQADVYGAVGLRAGWRWRLAGGDLTGEVGWRQVWFQASAGSIGYNVTIGSPEAALGWSGRF